MLHMPFDVAVGFAHLVLKRNQVTVDGKVIYPGALITGSGGNRRHNDFNPLFLSKFGENTHLVKVFVAEQPVFPRQNNSSDNATTHIPVKAIQFYPLVNALLSRYACHNLAALIVFPGFLRAPYLLPSLTA